MRLTCAAADSGDVLWMDNSHTRFEEIDFRASVAMNANEIQSSNKVMARRFWVTIMF